MADVTAGDPITGVKWTRKSTRVLARALQRRGYHVGATTVRHLLHSMHFALRVNRKRLTRRQVPERDAQFRAIARTQADFLRRGLPVLSIDTKKREFVGLFKNPGRAWRRAPRDVHQYDFRDDAIGVAIPYGVYDVGRDEGYVLVGTSHATPAFATAAVRAWWDLVGRCTYAGCRELLLQADAGGANASRARGWLVAVQQFADATGLTITVTHYPTGASKWNAVEHRLFSRISANWAGQPLESYETVLKYLRTTRTGRGRRCRAHLDPTHYPTGVVVSDRELARVRLRRHAHLPKWNYTISPHRRGLQK